ncbi:MAG: HAD family hydrolase [Candidatus Heimdallarchaeota archaeon]|nr:HAD family hydrolase [Candidatus Heimdallarchaeota archaeon]
MKYKYLLFDLDGTLLHFDPNEFIRSYLGAASKYFIDLIPDPQKFISELLKSTDVMEKGDDPTTTTLEEFERDFCPKFEADCNVIRQRFFDFYQTDFKVIEPLITKMDGAVELLNMIKENHPETKIVLATNPVFPFISIERRMEWGGISQDYFDLITHAENSTYCKGNKKYWDEINEKIGGTPEESIVIGNDGYRDMSAKLYGFDTFLVEENLENVELMTTEIQPDYRGTLADLYDLLK